ETASQGWSPAARRPADAGGHALCLAHGHPVERVAPRDRRLDDRLRPLSCLRTSGVFERLWAAGLGEFDELVGIDWEWLAMDGVMTKAPVGRAATAEVEGIGHNPTDRGKHGTKRSTPSEGHGLPLAVVVA